MRASVLPFSPKVRRAVDALLVVWVACWVFVGIRVGHEVRGLSDLSETVIRSGVAIAESANALDALDDVPLVGSDFGDVTNRVREAGESAQASGRSSQESVRNLSILLGLAIAVMPSLPVVGFYLPLRLRLVREARTVRSQLRRGQPDGMLELLAGRAVHNLPYRTLVGVSENPYDDLRAHRFETLAAAELTRLGLADEIPAGWKADPARAVAG